MFLYFVARHVAARRCGSQVPWSAAACCRLRARSSLRRAGESSGLVRCDAASCVAEGASKLAHSTAPWSAAARCRLRARSSLRRLKPKPQPTLNHKPAALRSTPTTNCGTSPNFRGASSAEQGASKLAHSKARGARQKSSTTFTRSMPKDSTLRRNVGSACFSNQAAEQKEYCVATGTSP